MATASKAKKKPEILSVVFQDKAELYRAYMPFIKNGGLFVPTSQTFELGANVQVEIQLMNGFGPKKFTGKIVWISPPKVQYHFQEGIGVQFQDRKGEEILKDVELQLMGTFETDNLTDTL